MPTLPTPTSSQQEPEPPQSRGLPAPNGTRRTPDERARRATDDVAIRAPRRLVEPEPDYQSPSPRERARLLRAAWEASAADAEQHLLLAEIMAHYRAWCVRRGLGDPFVREAAPRGD